MCWLPPRVACTSMSRKRRSAAVFWPRIAFLVSFTLLAFLFLLTLYSGSFYPPQPYPSYHLKELPWLRSSPHDSFTSLCKSSEHAGDSQAFLVAVIFNRVYGRDLFGIGPYECRQWIEYMLYAGVEHIYWYDMAHSNAETLEAYLLPYVDASLLTYTRFHKIFLNSLSEGFHFEQDNSYRHFLRHYGHQAKWVVQMDVDEYPFSMDDNGPCFLQRLVKEYEISSSNVTQILLQCMTFAGNPQGDLMNGWVIERYKRRKYETEGVKKGYESRQKPIYRADLCKGILKENPHVVWMEDGKTVVASDNRIRMNHYWGAREVGFTGDDIESNAILVPDSTIQSTALRIKKATGLIKKKEDMIGVFLRFMSRI